MIEFSAAIAGAIKFIVDRGLGAYKASDERANLRLCVREQVRRELVFNKEVIGELRRQDQEEQPRWEGEGRARLIQALRSAAFDALDEQLVPLEVFFDDELTEGAHERIFRSVSTNEALEKQSVRVRDIGTQVELLERAYRRICFYKLYGESGGRRPNLDYLQLLLNGAVESLKSRSEQT